MQTIVQFVAESCKAASDHDGLWVALVSGASGVFGAGVVALLNYRSTSKASDANLQLESKKLHAGLVTTERLRWLQDIRVRLSNLFALLDTQFDLLRRPVSAPQKASRQLELDALSQKVMVEINNVTLMLNPNKPDQNDLRIALNSSLEIVVSSFAPGAHSVNSPLYAALKTDAFNALTLIGIETWTQIQKLE